MRYPIGFILFFSFFSLNGQNLLVNGSFEQHIPLANKQAQALWFPDKFNQVINGWKCNNNAFGYLADVKDRYKKDNQSFCLTDYTLPADGNAYISIGYHGRKARLQHAFCGTSTDATELYCTLSSKIIEDLELNQKYILSLQIKSIFKQNKDFTKAFGVLLSSKKTNFEPSWSGIKKIPTITFPNTKHNHEQWQSIETVFTADSSYRFFTIGFFNRPDINVENDETSIFIDNICLRKDDAANCSAKTKTTAFSFEPVFVYFDKNKSELKTTDDENLNSVVLAWEKEPSVIVFVTGHTDNSGKDNIILSQKRAESVAQELVKRGILASKIQTSWFGDLQSAASNDSAKGQELNRRVRIEVKK